MKDFGVDPIFEILKRDITSKCSVGIYKKEKYFSTQSLVSKRLSEKRLMDIKKKLFLINFFLLKAKWLVINKCISFYKICFRKYFLIWILIYSKLVSLLFF